MSTLGTIGYAKKQIRVRNNTDKDSFGDCCLNGKFGYSVFALPSFNFADYLTSNSTGVYCCNTGSQFYQRLNVATQPKK
ncbi:hypothetical protein J6590_036620 [Homalodisca vitripennis]|nr:hypothetical protein J6590_036620 [Homalodisca vitripennis]